LNRFAEIIDYINKTGIGVVTFSDVFDGNLGPARPYYENSGVAILPANATEVTVYPDLPLKPKVVVVTPADGSVGSCWVKNITETSFTIACSKPPFQNVTVYWYASSR
jgi:hypothetical protein